MPGPRRNRDRKPGRQTPFREPKPIILIVSEGEKTEPQYFDGFSRACHNPRVEIYVPPEHGVPKTLVEIAKEHQKKAEADARREGDDNLAYDSVWCVFDRDDHPHVPDAQQMARDNDIQLSISNPCFELWLLLHFRDDPGMQHPGTEQKNGAIFERQESAIRGCHEGAGVAGALNERTRRATFVAWRRSV
jgi:RloB-like protein